MKETMVLKANEAYVEEFDWGKLHWFASGKLGNSDKMTIGKCIIKPGCENPRHKHSNCQEVLHVLAGKIIHYVEDKYFQMGSGDTITVPSGLLHSAIIKHLFRQRIHLKIQHLLYRSSTLHS